MLYEAFGFCFSIVFCCITFFYQLQTFLLTKFMYYASAWWICNVSTHQNTCWAWRFMLSVISVTVLEIYKIEMAFEVYNCSFHAGILFFLQTTYTRTQVHNYVVLCILVPFFSLGNRIESEIILRLVWSSYWNRSCHFEVHLEPVWYGSNSKLQPRAEWS